MSRRTSRGMLGLVWLVPCVLVLFLVLLHSCGWILITMSLCGVGWIGALAALLLTLLLAIGVYSMRDTLEAGADRRNRDVGRLVIAFFIATSVWGNLVGIARDGEATAGALAAMFVCIVAAQFSLLTLLLFGIRSIAARFRRPARESVITRSKAFIST